MFNNKSILKLTSFIAFFFLINACIKDSYDGPDTDCVIEKPEGDRISIKELKDSYSGLITADVFVEGTVIGDDKSGNIYKQIYIQDSTAGISLIIDRTNYNTLFPINRNVYVKLKGLYLNNDSELVGNDDDARILNSQVDNHIKRGACFQDLQPTVLSLDDLNFNNEGQLVTIKGVEFVDGKNGITYADAVNELSLNLEVADCNGNSITVRSSGFANFAGDTVPAGNGSITGIYSTFNSTNQLTIRNTDDVDMTENRCDGSSGGGGNGLFSDDFSSQDLTTKNWNVQTIVGTFDWETSDQGSTGNFYAKASNYSGGNTASETWLITPAIDLSATTTPVLNFRNAYNFAGAPLETYVSTDYDGSSDPNTSGTWIALSPILSTGSFAWTSSGNINLAPYKSTTTYIGFKYTGTMSDGSKWEIDDLIIEEM